MNPKSCIKQFLPSAMQAVKRDDLYQSLSLQQKAVFNYVVFQRKSIFFSGQAGAGKSYLLRAIIEKMQALIAPQALAVTAMTGIAAVNIKGQTLHSLFGSSLEMHGQTPDENIKQALRTAFGRKTFRETLEKLEVLLIDEVSMLQAKQFDALDLLFRRIKHNGSLFGGLYIILCGDFMQLPPVDKTSQVAMLFESIQFQTLKYVQLTNQFRQSDDKLLSILNKIRDGQIDEEVVRTLGTRTLNEVFVNQNEQQSIQQAYKAFDLSQANAKADLESLGQRCKGVPFLKKAKLIRATQEHSSVVLNQKFMPPTFPIRLYSYKRQVEQYNHSRLSSMARPVVTIRSNDSGKVDKIDSLDQEIEISIGSQVMLRKNLLVAQGMCNGTVGVVSAIFYREMDKNPDKKVLDAVNDEVQLIFKTQTNQLLVKAVEQEQTENNGQTKVGSRKQLPIMLCYAISIHKSQGLTLESAVMSLDKCFENGQAYVALSRIKSLEGMFILGIDYKTIRVNQKCIEYHKKILKLNQQDPDSFVTNGLFGRSYNLIYEFTFDATVFELFEQYNKDAVAEEQLAYLAVTYTLAYFQSAAPPDMPQERYEPQRSDGPDDYIKEDQYVKPYPHGSKIKILGTAPVFQKATEMVTQQIVDLSDSEPGKPKPLTDEPVWKPSRILIKRLDYQTSSTPAQIPREQESYARAREQEPSAVAPPSGNLPEYTLAQQFTQNAESDNLNAESELYQFDFFLQYLDA